MYRILILSLCFLGGPVIIEVDSYVSSVSSINEKNMVRKKNIKNTQIDPRNALIKKGCLPLTKRFQEILLERKRNTTCRVLPVENFREQRNFWKGSPVFPDGMLWTKFISHLFIPVLGFHGHLSVKMICANGKRDSGAPGRRF